jgi:hypothetical protein
MTSISDRNDARAYAEGAFLRASAMWALAGLTGAFGTLFLDFSRGHFDFTSLSRELTLGLSGGLLGLGHSRYQYFLLESFPGHYADLARLSREGWTLWKGRQGASLVRPVVHPGRGWVPLAYGGGFLATVVLAFLLYRGIPPVSSAFFAAGGFFLARVIFWKRAVDLWKSEGSE